MKSIVVVSTFLVVAVAACGGAQTKADPAPQAAVAAPAAAATAPAPAAVAAVPAGEVKCPVSGEVFTPSASSPSADHNGKTYYFCCGGCKRKFEAAPDKFAAAYVPAAAGAPKAAGDSKPCGDCGSGKECSDCGSKDGVKKDGGK
ncbi:MAG: YHS domain-containing protein [Myxococcales bacterium]|nr:YHS domain-containing protein [Myxococcales bacterium]